MWQLSNMSSKYLGGFLTAGLSRRLYTGARRNAGPGVRQQVDASAPTPREVSRSQSLARKRFSELTEAGAPTFSHFLTDTHGRAHDYLRISISERWGGADSISCSSLVSFLFPYSKTKHCAPLPLNLDIINGCPLRNVDFSLVINFLASVIFSISL